MLAIWKLSEQLKPALQVVLGDQVTTPVDRISVVSEITHI